MNIPRFSFPFRSCLSLMVGGSLLLQGWLSAATHYLMVQGVGQQSHYWRIDYDPAVVNASSLNGQWAMNAIFGTPTQVVGTQYISQRTPGTSVSYENNPQFGLFLNSFTINGATAAPVEDGYWASWYVGGGYIGDDQDADMVSNDYIPFGAGGGQYDYAPPFSWIAYQANTWISGPVGLQDRLLYNPGGAAGVSYDAWVYGAFGTEPTAFLQSLSTIGTLNWGQIFSGQGFTVYAVPEPSRWLLLMFAGVALVARRRRK